MAAALLATAALAGLVSATAVPAGAAPGDGVVRGGANANADSMAFLINNAGAALGWTFGRSTAQYRDITATAEGKSVDLGALAALLGQPQCFGELPPALDPATLPPQTVADSAVEGSDVPVRAEVRLPKLTGDRTPAPVVGTQEALARRTPYSEGSTATTDQDFGFFRVEGATSRAWTSFEDGVRTAHAESAARRIVVFGGQVVFNGPRWAATATSGAQDGQEAEFTFDSASVFGNWVSGATLARDLLVFETLIERVFAFAGLDLAFPRVVQPAAGTGIAVSPMSVTLSNAPIGRGLLIPLLRTDVLERYRQDSVSEDCRRETFWTIIDALERALGGSGSVQTLIGGASATTDDTDYSFTPLVDPAPAPTEGPPPADAVPPDGGSLPFDGGVPIDGFTFEPGFEDFGGDLFPLDATFDEPFGDSFLGDVDPGTFLAEDVTATEPIGDTGAAGDGGEELAASSGGPGPGGDAAAVAMAVLGVLGALALSFGDRFHQARTRRRIP